MRTLSLFVCLAVTTPAFAGSGEGEMKMKYNIVAGQHGTMTGTITVHFSKVGTRTEMASDGNAMMQAPSTLVLNDKPETIYQINDAGHSYSEINRGEHHGSATYTVKKAGSDTVAGYKAEHAIVTSSAGETFDVWVNKELYELAKQFTPGGRQGFDSEGVMQALKTAGVVGVPVRFVVTRAGHEDEKSTIELVSVSHKAQDASLFEIPSDYKKSGAGGAHAGGMQSLTPEQRAQIMQNLTPEQRAQMEKAMGGQQ